MLITVSFILQGHLKNYRGCSYSSHILSQQFQDLLFRSRTVPKFSPLKYQFLVASLSLTSLIDKKVKEKWLLPQKKLKEFLVQLATSIEGNIGIF